jgi:phosphotriesterase-related protein
MSIPGLVGKIQTVLGPIPAEDLGITLTHEHLLWDFSCYFVEPAAASEKGIAYQPVSLENLGWILYNSIKNLDNIRLWDKEIAVSEAFQYKQAGGSAIVDMTNIGIGRDPQGLQYVARSTGLHVIMGSGYYLGISHPSELGRKTEEEITEEMVRDITIGVNDTGVRAGIIGEIGCSYPLMTDGERKVLRAAARAQQRTGAPIAVHPGYPNENSLFEIIEVLGEAGGDLNRTVLCHMDYFEFADGTEQISNLAEAGCYIEYDNFGRLGRITGRGKLVDLPSEGQRLDTIKQVIDQGHLNKILISQDLCLKMRLTRHGGTGYGYILHHLIPLMRAKGFSEKNIHTLLVENPKRLLQFV